MFELNIAAKVLESGLDQELFEIKSANLDDNSLSFYDKKVTCILSSEKQWHGFQIIGEIIFLFIEFCDRC